MRAACTLLLLTLAACAGDETKDTDTDGGGATFTAVYDTVLNPTDTQKPSCELAGCHAAPSSNGMELDGRDNAYASLVDVDSEFATGEVLVIPGDADNSYLVKKLEGASGITGDPMPPPFGGIDPADVQLVRDWIDAGAADD
jgi:hypothetical protein